MFARAAYAFIAITLSSSLSSLCWATVVFSDFSTFTDGNLVGQGGWQQFGTTSTNPIQVASGVVTWPGGATTSNQDAISVFPSLIAEPTTGTTTLFFALRLSILSAASNPSYFAALSVLDSTSTSGNFANIRLSAEPLGSGFAFGARVTGQAGYPYVFGTTELSFGTEYTLVAEVNMVAGAQNDVVRIFVNPPNSDFASQTPYAVSSYTTGAATDPTSFGGVILSQFGAATIGEPGVAISRLVVTFDGDDALAVIPEPGAAGLLVVGLLALLALRSRRRAATSC